MQHLLKVRRQANGFGAKRHEPAQQLQKPVVAVVVVGADEQLQAGRDYQQWVDADDSVADEAAIVNVFVPGNDGEDEAADDHEQRNAGVAFIDQADQWVGAAQVALGVVKEVEQHHQAGRQKAQMVKSAQVRVLWGVHDGARP